MQATALQRTAVRLVGAVATRLVRAPAQLTADGGFKWSTHHASRQVYQHPKAGSADGGVTGRSMRTRSCD